jgi:hypothetical protein
MVNEGIMALPQDGMPMQNEAPVDDSFTVSSADSYDAAQTVLQERSPEEFAALKAAMRESLGDVELSPNEISSVLETLVYMSQNPAEYNQLRQNLINADVLDPEDLPEEYDPEFLGAMISLLHELQLMQFEGAQAPMMDMPPVQGADAMQGIDGGQPMAMAQGGLADMAAYMASQGRNGDTMLAHITPEEAQLLRSRGGSGTINPVTGLPEFFLKKLVKKIGSAVKKVLKSPVGRVLATVGLAAVLGPTAVGLTLGKAGTAALVSGGVTLAGGGSLKEALMAGATGYFGGGGTIGGFSPMSTLGNLLPGAAGSALNTGLSTGILGAGIGKLGGMSTQDALKAGLTQGLSAAALQGLENSRAGAQPAQAQTGMQPESPFSGAQSDGTARSMLSSVPDQRMSFSSPSAPGAAPAAAPASAAGAQSPGFFSQLFGTAAPAATLTPGTVSAVGGAGAAAAAPAAAAGMGLLPKMALGLLGAGALGGFKAKDTTNPISEAELERYKDSVKLAEERDKFIREGGYGLETPLIDRSFNPIVSTDYSAAMPFMAAPPVIPTGITRSPAGVAQPYNIAGMYGVPLVYGQGAALGAQDMYGVQGLAKGGAPVPTNFPRKTGPINGPGTGTSDDIPAMLSDGEFVFTAKAVRNAGAGSRRKGAKRMYKLMKMLEGGPVKGK